jgi:hypothetical protein
LAALATLQDEKADFCGSQRDIKLGCEVLGGGRLADRGEFLGNE